MATRKEGKDKATSEEPESDIPKYCQPCSVDHKQVQAVGLCSNCKEFLCDDCFKCHTKPTLTRHHVLQRTVKEKTDQKAKDKCTEKCTKHEKVIKYYCSRHNDFGCSVCITLQHRQCEDVVYISEASKNFPESTLYQEFKANLGTLQKQSEDLVPEAEQNHEYAEQNHQTIVDTIQAFRKQINDAFDKLEKGASAQALKAKDEETKKFQGITAKCRDILKKIQEITTRLDDLVGNGQLCDAYMATKRSEEQIEMLVKQLATLQDTCYRKEYVFNPHVDLIPKHLGHTVLGTLFNTSENRKRRDKQSSAGFRHGRKLNKFEQAISVEMTSIN